MIGVILSYGSDIIKITVYGDVIGFSTSNYGSTETTIDYLKLDRNGVIKEFPDLDGREDWRTEAIKRFKKKILSLNKEEARIKYIIEDLKKWGYKPMYIQKSGFRPQKYNDSI